MDREQWADWSGCSKGQGEALGVATSLSPQWSLG